MCTDGSTRHAACPACPRWHPVAVAVNGHGGTASDGACGASVAPRPWAMTCVRAATMTASSAASASDAGAGEDCGGRIGGH